jgi:hypothetical protein
MIRQRPSGRFYDRAITRRQHSQRPKQPDQSLRPRLHVAWESRRQPWPRRTRLGGLAVTIGPPGAPKAFQRVRRARPAHVLPPRVLTTHKSGDLGGPQRLIGYDSWGLGRAENRCGRRSFLASLQAPESPYRGSVIAHVAGHRSPLEERWRFRPPIRLISLAKGYGPRRAEQRLLETEGRQPCAGRTFRRGLQGGLSSSPAPTAALSRITRVLVGSTAIAKRREVVGVVAAAQEFGRDVIDGRGHRQAPSTPAGLAEVVVSSEHERSELPPPRPIAPCAGALAVVLPRSPAMLGARLAGAHQPGAQSRAARPLRCHRTHG